MLQNSRNIIVLKLEEKLVHRIQTIGVKPSDME